MKKSILRVILWVSTIVFSVIVIFTQREQVIVQELINAEVYLTTEPIKSNENYMWKFNTSNRNLSAIEIAFVYEENKEKNYPVLIEMFCDENIVMKKEINLIQCPNKSFWKLEIPEKIREGTQVTIRITNLSEEASDTEFSMLYTDNKYRYLENVGMYCINDEELEGQFISRYSYAISYEYYKALTIIFGIVLLSIVLDGYVKQFKKCI